jgi:hypothetical protein
MSRSYHQRHPLQHNKSNRHPYPFRKRKMKPFGLKYFIGFGEEEYFKKFGEVFITKTCKRIERHKVNLE